jgi:DinB superfamily
MDQAIAAVSPLFHANDQLFHRALEGVKPQDLWRRPEDSSNPLIWIAGHLMTSRVSLTRLAGERIENPWSKIFTRGVTFDANVTYPEISDIVSLWDLTTHSLMKRLEELDDATLSEQASFPVPTGDKTKRGAIVFLNFHETYHIGQMAYLRKWLGYSQLVG